jgi:hypothetical protein
MERADAIALSAAIIVALLEHIETQAICQRDPHLLARVYRIRDEAEAIRRRALEHTL